MSNIEWILIISASIHGAGINVIVIKEILV